MSPRPSLHLHIGAHKTATTHMQAVLTAARPAMAEAGAVYLGPDRLRGFEAELLYFPHQGWVARRLGVRAARRRLGALIRAEGQGPAPRLVVLSEENVIGSCGRVLRSGRVYTGLARRAGPFGAVCADLFDMAQSVVFFSIRSYGPFFASAHSQLARHRRDAPLMALPREALQSLPRRWPDVVRDLRRLFPESRFVVWRYEDFRAVRPELLGALSGGVVAPGTKAGGRHPSLSGDAVAEVMAREAARGRPLTPDEVREIGDATAVSDGHARYDPWTGPETARFDAAYAEDWAAIQAMEGIETLASRQDRDLGSALARPL